MNKDILVPIDCDLYKKWCKYMDIDNPLEVLQNMLEDEMENDLCKSNATGAPSESLPVKATVNKSFKDFF